MSKIIMNEVMCLADDHNIDIYYQDTDSMHMNHEDVDKIGDLFREKSGRELIGSDLGQFHTDFEFEGAKKGADIYAVESYFLSQKVYIKFLESVDKKDSIIRQANFRMKGIPDSCITYTAKKKKRKVIDVYKDMYDGKGIEFDLTEGGHKCMFKYLPTMEVRNYEKGEFHSYISFKEEIERVEI